MPPGLDVTNGWNNCSAMASLIPEPVSSTLTRHGLVAGRADRQVADRAVDHRVDRVADEVDQHLLDLDAVDEHQVGAGIERKLHVDLVLARADQRQGIGLVDQPLQAFDVPLGLSMAHEIAQPADDLAGADRLLGGLVHRLAHHRQRLGDPDRSRAGRARFRSSWRPRSAAG